MGFLNMKDSEVGKYWEGNADVWTQLSRMGMDVTRDNINTPGFLSILPDIRGKIGLDIVDLVELRR